MGRQEERELRHELEVNQHLLQEDQGNVVLEALVDNISKKLQNFEEVRVMGQMIRRKVR